MTLNEFEAALKLLGYTYKRKVMKREKRYWIYQTNPSKCIGRFSTTIGPDDILDGAYRVTLRLINENNLNGLI